VRTLHNSEVFLLVLSFFVNFWRQQLATGRSLICASWRGGWGECSCPRSATAIHSVAVDRTPNLPIERRTLSLSYCRFQVFQCKQESQCSANFKWPSEELESKTRDSNHFSGTLTQHITHSHNTHISPTHSTLTQHTHIAHTHSTYTQHIYTQYTHVTHTH